MCMILKMFNMDVRIERLLKDLGWKKQADKNSDDFKLKWVEVRSAINYDSFREGTVGRLNK